MYRLVLTTDLFQKIIYRDLYHCTQLSKFPLDKWAAELCMMTSLIQKTFIKYTSRKEIHHTFAYIGIHQLGRSKRTSAFEHANICTNSNHISYRTCAKSHYKWFCKWTVKALIRLPRSAGRSRPLLSVYSRIRVIARRGPNCAFSRTINRFESEHSNSYKMPWAPSKDTYQPVHSVQSDQSLHSALYG